MLKYNCNKEIGKEVITMSLHSNYYLNSDNLAFGRMDKVNERYQKLTDEYEDRIKKNYDTLMAVLKDGTILSGKDLGELIYVELTSRNMKQLMPVLDAIYNANPKAFKEFGFNNYYVSLSSGKELGLFIISDDFEDLECFYDEQESEQIIDAFCKTISKTKVDLHDFPQVFKEVYDLNNEDDLKLWQKKNNKKDGNY